MIHNCGDQFNQYHATRYSKMTPAELIEEYDAICAVLCLDNAGSLFCIDELLVWQTLIAERCVEIVRSTLETGTPKG